MSAIPTLDADELRRRVFEMVGRAKAAALQDADNSESAFDGDDTDTFEPVGLDNVLRSSEKLLRINRGEEDPDDRDNLAFKRFMTPERLLAERIRIDTGKIRRGLLRNAVKFRSLKGASPMVFNDYSEGLIVQNPMSMPLEEINPMHLIEQARRTTQMGPGGVGSEDAITLEMQANHPSQFGFISGIEGPESSRIGIDTRLSWGVKYGSDGRIYQEFIDRRTGKRVLRSPDEVDQTTVKIPD